MPTTTQDFRAPRHYMGQHIYREEILGDFLVKGLVKYVDTIDGHLCERLRLPTKGESKSEEIDDISKSLYHIWKNKE